MELRLNNQSIETDDLSQQAREDLARTVAFNRDTALGQLAVLGYPEDHPYEAKVIEREAAAKPAQLSLDNHHGFSLGH